MPKPSLILLTPPMLSLLALGAWAQQKSTQPAGSAQRTAQIKALASEILLLTKEDVSRVTEQYIEDHINQIRKIVQEQILETLSLSDKPADVRDSLRLVLSDTTSLRE